MGVFISVFRQNLMMQLGQIRRNLLLVFVPVVIFFFIYLYFSMNQVSPEFVSPIVMALVDEDDNAYSDMLLESFKNNPSFSQFVKIEEGKPEDLRSDFEQKSLDVLITVPKGFQEGLSTTEPLPLDVQINYQDPIKAILFRNVMTAYETYIRSIETGVIMIDYELYYEGVAHEVRWSYRDRALVNLIFTALARNTFFEMKPIVNVPSTGALNYYFIGIMVMCLMYMAVFSAVNLLREEQDHCLRRLRITEVPMTVYMLAKALAMAAYMYLIVTIWMLLYSLFYGRLWEGPMLGLLGFLMVCILFDVAVAMFFTVFFKTEEPVILLSSIFIFFNAVIGGSVIPLQSMPYVLQRLAVTAPNYWMIRGFLFIDHRYGLDEIWLVAFGLFGLSMLLIGITGFRYGREVI